MSMYQKSPESARSAEIPYRSSSVGAPFHPGLFGRYATQIAHFHAILDVINPAQISTVEALQIDQMIAELTSSLNRLFQELAVASRPGYAMVQSEPGDRAKQLFKDALETAKMYKDAYLEIENQKEKKCQKARQNLANVPIFDGITINGKDFWPRWQYYVETAPLPDIEKFDLLLTKLDGEIKDAVKNLPFDDKSYNDAFEILQRF